MCRMFIVAGLGRRSQRCLTLLALISLGLLVFILLGMLPIGWLIYPSGDVGGADAADKSSETHHNHDLAQSPPHFSFESNVDDDKTESQVAFSVDILADAAISLYLWQHILKGKLISKQEGNLLYGFQTLEGIKAKFHTGPSIQPTISLLSGLTNVVFVLNGRTDERVDRSRKFLDLVPQSPHVENVAIVLLGNEQCQNEWLLWYLEAEKYRIRAVFVVYDSKLVDNQRVFQWPLGVATYRGFPLINPKDVDILENRPYLCHFMGTVYRNNSRLDLMKALQSSPLQSRCFVKVRYEWPESESHQSATEYLKSLRESESVLSPMGMNSECYRIYESLALGVLPIIEDQRAYGICDKPYRLLKELNLPAIFVENWDELPSILEYLATLSDTELMHQRNKILKWYHRFLDSMRNKFVQVLKRNFIML